MVKKFGTKTIKKNKRNTSLDGNQNNEIPIIKQTNDQMNSNSIPCLKPNNTNDMERDNKESIGVKKKQKRYILFVGNLPYGITKKQLATFFKGLDVISLRLLDSKIDKKPHGCAFVELKTSKDFTAGLKYHRQMLDGRCIRVERTVGGGGKGKSRQQKLKQVNRKLRKSRKNTWEKVLKKKEVPLD
ncbi:uncharacterized protein LOC128883075 isoform X2 [Hylaeus volcanicus]|uniref:uncharacterized protein LOC128883075 isoform X2 n=1 Tax=Hylaeus volcanicus TaxID=313075 RepID=UPI0023B86D66|nr:uncharacterized protein LOC128883075 isoform X2 [Hylaeus volcanicus]